MPLRDMKCTKCGKVQEHFFWANAGHSDIRCEDCDERGMELLPVTAGTTRKTGVFPFTSTHITGDGTPVVVENMQHLRSLERKYGVLLTGFSNNRNNPDSPQELPKFRPGGRDYEG